tara:strand:+ start:45 stop:611 length:567 start_codon:yes stop_codon:yes gene_type:complete
LSDSVTITLPKVGKVLLERSFRAKHIRMSIKPLSNIRVAVPVGVSFKEAQKFAEKKEYWLEKQIQSFTKLKKPPIYDSGRLFAGEEILRNSDSIIRRVKQLARENGFKHNKITIKLMKSRWGSCSSRNNISINILVGHLPKRLQDYIFMHELMHTKIKNHSKHFWNELGKVVDDLKELRRELREDYIL